MSLKLYAPHEFEVEEHEFPQLTVYHEPDPESPADHEVLSWRFVRRDGHPSFIEVLHRSRLLHQHRRCHECGRPTVQPVEKNDGVLGKNRLPVPGTSTVVGFHCDYCQSEWSA